MSAICSRIVKYSGCFRLVDEQDNKFGSVTALCQLWDGQWSLNGSLPYICASKIEENLTNQVRMLILLIILQASNAKLSRKKCSMPEWQKWLQTIDGIDSTLNSTKGEHFRCRKSFWDHVLYIEIFPVARSAVKLALVTVASPAAILASATRQNARGTGATGPPWSTTSRSTTSSPPLWTHALKVSSWF